MGKQHKKWLTTFIWYWWLLVKVYICHIVTRITKYILCCNDQEVTVIILSAFKHLLKRTERNFTFLEPMTVVKLIQHIKRSQNWQKQQRCLRSKCNICSSSRQLVYSYSHHHELLLQFAICHCSNQPAPAPAILTSRNDMR